MKRDLSLAGATLLAHLLVASRYDFFRDELYFIVCGRHPAFGYVDQPPLVPLLAAATQAFGENLFLLRALAALAAAATVIVTCRLARLAGARDFGALLAGLAAAAAPMYLGLMTTVGTSTFEPLAWTALAYFVARAVLLDDGRAWLWAGVVVGIDLELKYELPLYLVPLLVALLATRQLKARKALFAGITVAAALAAPSAIWQLTHGLPFLEMMRAQAAGKNRVLGPAAFTLNQVLVMNPLFAPVWLAGAIAPFADKRLAAWRFLSLAFVLTFALMVTLHAKDYYLAPAYGTVFAVGGAAFEHWLRRRTVRMLWPAAALALSAVAAPLAMPILDPPLLARYSRALGLAPVAAENLRQSGIPQTFADMLGWREYVRKVSAAYQSLPPGDRARAALFTGNYGEAAALDFFGRGLPPALSGHNQYWMWGPRGFDGSILIRVNEEPDELRPRCRSVRLLDRFGAPYVMPYENDAPLTLCRALHPPLGELWPEVKHYY